MNPEAIPDYDYLDPEEDNTGLVDAVTTQTEQNIIDDVEEPDAAFSLGAHQEKKVAHSPGTWKSDQEQNLEILN